MASGTHDRVWLITGASAGFGRALAEAALAAGDTVVGAARRVALAHMRRQVRTGGGSQPGDPAKAAQAIITAITAEDPPLRLVLGGDAVAGRLRALQAELAECQLIGRATSLESQPIPAQS